MPTGIYKRTKEQYIQIGNSNRGKKRSEITKNKIRKVRTGTHQPESTRRKISNSLKGEKHPCWIDGRSIENDPYSQDWSECLKESIRKRDSYICQECGIHQDELIDWNKKLDVHHIDYNKDDLNPTNLISLCRSCHAKTGFNREYWTKYFSQKELFNLRIQNGNKNV